MRAKEFIPASKPRNFVAKNQKTAGAGAHRDKKKEQKQGYEKHKGKTDEGFMDKIKGAAKELTRDSLQKKIKQAWENTFWPKHIEPALNRIQINGRPFRKMVLGEPRMIENDRSQRAIFKQYTVNIVFPIDPQDWANDEIEYLEGQLQDIQDGEWNPKVQGLGLVSFDQPMKSFQYTKGETPDLVIPVRITSLDINRGLVGEQGVAEGSEQVYKVIAVDKSNALGRRVKLNVKANSVDEVFERLAMSDWYPLSINGAEVIDGRRLKPGVSEGSGKSVVKSVKVGDFRHDLVDTGFGWQVRIYNGDELYDTGMSKNSEQKGLIALDDAVSYTKKQLNIKEQGVSEGDEPDEQYLDKVISDLHKDALGFRPDQEFGREWMSSSFKEKLEIYHNLLKSLNSDMDEGIGGTIVGGVGQFFGNKIDPLAGEIMRAHGEIAGRKAEYTIRKYMHLLKQALEKQLKSGDENEDMKETQDDWGSMSHREFKRRELQHELGHEDDPEFQRQMREKDRGPWYIRIDGKIYKQKGEPKVFDWKKGANNYALAIVKNRPELKDKTVLTRNPVDQ